LGETLSAAYLCSSCGVLRSTSSQQLGIAVLHELLEQSHVLFLGQDGIVWLEAILLKKGLITVLLSMFRIAVESTFGYVGIGTDPWPWMSSNGFSRQSSS